MAARLLFLLICLFIGMPGAAFAKLPQKVGTETVPSLAPMLKKVLPSVVNIAVTGEIKYPYNPFSRPGDRSPNADNNDNSAQQFPSKFESLGSGVIADAQKGYIVTNAHVLRQAKVIMVTLNDGRQFKAKIVGMDPPSDIAVLQIHAEHLTALPFANSDDLQVGDFVVAIGNPFGLNESVTSGIVSALQRTGLGIENYENFIQTDAPINPGNSGGALVNLQGELIGVNTAILAPEGGNIGIGFAIPSNMVKSVMEQLIQYGSVRRGLMGIMIQNLTPVLAQALNLPGSASPTGALVTSVNQFSPAEKAGIKAGDIIQKVNGRTVKDATEVANIVGLMRVGSEVHLNILRHNKTLNINLATAAPNDYIRTSESKNPFLFGLNLRDFSQFNVLHGEIKGVQVTYVADGSPASHALPIPLLPGDIIISANQQPIHSVKDLQRIANNTKKKSLLLNVYRQSGAIYVVIR